MALPPDLNARQVQLLARMANDELDALRLPPGQAVRLTTLLHGIEAAATDLSAELAPLPVMASREALSTPIAAACQVYDLSTRRRLA